MSDLEEDFMNGGSIPGPSNLSPISSALAAQGLDVQAMMEGDEEDENTVYQEEAEDNTPAEADLTGLSIPISFSGGGAWDDRELINAFDAAKEEFELHNPGPGTWLDKATAALAMGQPLASATHKNSKWYTTYDPVLDPAAKPIMIDTGISTDSFQKGSGSGPGSNKKGKKNNKGKRKAGDSGRSDGHVLNPYLPTNKRVRIEAGDPRQSDALPPNPYRMQSPSFQPPSPSFAPPSPSQQQTTHFDVIYQPQEQNETVPLGPPLPDRISSSRTEPRRIPNYASLASPSPPPFSRSAPHIQSQPQRGPSQRGQGDPTYPASQSGVYPGMGSSGFVSGTEMTRETATMRAVNAQWWAGYWFAMSEVLPSGEGQ